MVEGEFSKLAFELLKVALGSFLGFGLALWSARIVDFWRRERDHFVAGNLALFVIAAHFSDFLLFRKDFRESAYDRGAHGEPLWALMGPTYHGFGKDDIDFQSIGFLFEQQKSAELFETLMHAQLAIRDLRRLTELRNDACLALQKAIGDLELQIKPQPMSIQIIEKSIPRHQLLALSSHVVALAMRAHDLEPVFRDAHDRLRESLESSLGTLSKMDWIVGFVFRKSNRSFVKLSGCRPGFDFADLKPLPAVLQGAIDKIVGQRRT